MTYHNDSVVARRLAKRVASAQPDTPPIHFNSTPAPEGLSDHLRKHLAGGETHYTARPGIPELRALIGSEIERRGGPSRDADGVIVTHGEGEALYVTLLGLGLGADPTIVVAEKCRHRKLFDLLDIAVVDPSQTSAATAMASYREFGDESSAAAVAGTTESIGILALGGFLFSSESRSPGATTLPSSAILIGHLDSVPGLDHFRIGYVAGPPEIVKRIQTWKQALSICTAGPSQRATLFAIEKERAS